MKFKGLLLKEGLNDLSVLDLIKTTKEEKWNIPNERLANFQPKIWTAILFEGEGKKVEEIVEKLSKAIKEKWYINVSFNNTEYVIFNNKIFKYEKGDDKTKQEAIGYGRKVGIPEKQLDW